MNMKIKRIIAMTLAISAFSVIGPIKNLDFMNKEAYAYSSSDDVAFLSDIDLDHGNISFSKTNTSYTKRVTNSVDEIQITATPQDSGYKVSIDGETKTGTWTKAVDLRTGLNTIRVRVEDPTGTYDPITYYLHITKDSSSSSSSDNEDDVYLDNITLSDGNISFSRKTKSYDVSVGANVSEMRIKAEPEYTDSTVKIDGTEVDEDDKYRKTVSLSQGKNTIKISVENGNDDRNYTLNIYRGTSIPTASAVGETDNTQDEIYLDDLILDDGDVPVSFKSKVSAYAVDVKDSHDSIIVKAEPDDTGDIVRVNGERVDSSYRKRVYLDQGKNVIKIKISNEDDYDDEDDDYEKRDYTLTVYRGTSQGTATATGTSVSNTASTNSNINANTKVSQWIDANGRWQYNDAAGNSLKNMWFFDKSYGAWYFLDELGYMKTGWIQDGSGKWYYLYPSGAMAYNTVINGYKLGSNGEWIR